MVDHAALVRSRGLQHGLALAGTGLGMSPSLYPKGWFDIDLGCVMLQTLMWDSYDEHYTAV